MDSKIGKYEILDTLGAGGMAVVYKARDPMLQRLVALKVINQRLQPGTAPLERFLHEARIAAGLTHPNIVVIHELGVERGQPFIAMELLAGRDLKDLIEQRYPFTLPQKLHMALQIVRALEHAHENGIIHRDVKPANIRVLQDGTVKLMDFGIATLEVEEQTALTRAGDVVGSVSYMSPEQLQGEPLTPASDVFAFGVVLYELLTYSKLFDAEDLSAIIFKIVDSRAPAPELNSVPEGLRDLVERCLAREPTRRPAGFEPVAAELVRIRELLAQERTSAAASVRKPEPAAPVALRPGRLEAGRPSARPAAARAATPGAVAAPWIPQNRPRPRSRLPEILTTFATLLIIGMMGVVAVYVQKPRWFSRDVHSFVRVLELAARQLVPLPEGFSLAPSEGELADAEELAAADLPQEAGAASRGDRSRAPQPERAGRRDAPSQHEEERVATATRDRPPVAPELPAGSWVPGRDALVLLPGGVRLEMAWIPPGRFLMGCSPRDTECSGDELPVHPVELDGFWIGRHEVTQAQWTAVMGSNPSEHRGPDLPVERVHWEQAREFLARTGEALRLPTEAEWEYAARAGNPAAQHGPIDDVAWHSANASGTTHPVGQRQANGFGLHDVLGNVWEWCESRYSMYPKTAEVNPRARDGDFAVSRGGSFLRTERYNRVSARNAAEPVHAAADLGFRAARSVSGD